MPPSHKPIMAWAVYNKSGHIILRTIRLRRVEAIAAHLHDLHDTWTWQKCYNAGLRTGRCRVIP